MLRVVSIFKCSVPKIVYSTFYCVTKHLEIQLISSSINIHTITKSQSHRFLNHHRKCLTLNGNNGSFTNTDDHPFIAIFLYIFQFVTSYVVSFMISQILSRYLISFLQLYVDYYFLLFIGFLRVLTNFLIKCVYLIVLTVYNLLVLLFVNILRLIICALKSIVYLFHCIYCYITSLRFSVRTLFSDLHALFVYTFVVMLLIIILLMSSKFMLLDFFLNYFKLLDYNIHRPLCSAIWTTYKTVYLIPLSPLFILYGIVDVRTALTICKSIILVYITVSILHTYTSCPTTFDVYVKLIFSVVREIVSAIFAVKSDLNGSNGEYTNTDDLDNAERCRRHREATTNRYRRTPGTRRSSSSSSNATTSSDSTDSTTTAASNRTPRQRGGNQQPVINRFYQPNQNTMHVFQAGVLRDNARHRANGERFQAHIGDIPMDNLLQTNIPCAYHIDDPPLYMYEPDIATDFGIHFFMLSCYTRYTEGKTKFTTLLHTILTSIYMYFFIVLFRIYPQSRRPEFWTEHVQLDGVSLVSYNIAGAYGLFSMQHVTYSERGIEWLRFKHPAADPNKANFQNFVFTLTNMEFPPDFAYINTTALVYLWECQKNEFRLRHAAKKSYFELSN